MKAFIVLVSLALLTPTLATAQTMALYVDAGGILAREYTVFPSTVFEVVTVLDTNGQDVSYVEWVQTDLVEDYPGVFRLSGTTIACDINLDIQPPGEFQLPVCGGCAPASDQLLLARLGYFDVSGLIGSDAVMTIRGFEAGDVNPSNFGGSPGFTDCSAADFTAVMQGGDAWMTGAGVVVPSGAVVLNPTPPLVVEAGSSSVTRVKAIFGSED